MGAITVDTLQQRPYGVSAGTLHRLRAVRAGVRRAARTDDGAGARLSPSLPELVLAVGPHRAQHVEHVVEGLAAAEQRSSLLMLRFVLGVAPVGKSFLSQGLRFRRAS